MLLLPMTATASPSVTLSTAPGPRWQGQVGPHGTDRNNLQGCLHSISPLRMIFSSETILSRSATCFPTVHGHADTRSS